MFKKGNKAAVGRKGSPRKLIANTVRDQFIAELRRLTPAVLKTVGEKAIGGDMTACRLILDRSIPVHSVVTAEMQQQIDQLREALEEQASTVSQQ